MLFSRHTLPYSSHRGPDRPWEASRQCLSLPSALLSLMPQSQVSSYLRCEIPEAKGSIPGARKGKLAIRGDDHITDKVGVAPQSSLWDAVVSLVSGQLPHDDGFV